MTPECAKHYTDSLGRELNRAFDAVKLRALWTEMKKESDAAMAGAYDFIIRSQNFPSEEGLLKIIQVEGQKIRMAEAKANEEEYERQKPKRWEPTFLTQKQRTDHGKMAMNIYRLATPLDDHGMPRNPDKEDLKQLVTACEHMENAYPTEKEGWYGLKMHFVNMGLNLGRVISGGS